MLLGRADISEEQLINIIHDCQLENIISKKEGGLQAILSENANNLSAGEKQRLGIARALLGNPDIIIFDEVTSNLDMLSEKHIIDMISNSCKNTTCIFVAHRLQTIQHCDEIFVFDKGEIIESGTPKELYAKKGMYYQLLCSEKMFE